MGEFFSLRLILPTAAEVLMIYNPDLHKRRSIRMKGYDYSLCGLYFITLCVNKSLCLLGEISEGRMNLNDAGKTIDDIWQEIPENYKGVYIDEYAVMPNHLHGIIMLDNENVGAPPRGRPIINDSEQTQGPAPTTGRLSLGDIVGRFKSFTSKTI